MSNIVNISISKEERQKLKELYAEKRKIKQFTEFSERLTEIEKEIYEIEVKYWPSYYGKQSI